jgi:hypothetical protein
VNVFTLDSNEHSFRSGNLVLPQDSHYLRGSARDLWTVDMHVNGDGSFYVKGCRGKARNHRTTPYKFVAFA